MVIVHARVCCCIFVILRHIALQFSGRRLPNDYVNRPLPIESKYVAALLQQVAIDPSNTSLWETLSPLGSTPAAELLVVLLIPQLRTDEVHQKSGSSLEVGLSSGYSQSVCS